MLYFDKSFGKGVNGVNHAEQYKHVVHQRNAFNAASKPMVMANRELSKFVGNAAAVIPRDVYQEFDNTTKALMRADDLTLMNDLMPLGKALPVGKIEHIYRKASDSGIVTTSVTGQTPVGLDKTAYDYASTIKVIHQTGFGRGWMEMEGQRSEAFDGLIDDNENAVRNMRSSIASHFYNGTSDTFNGTTAVGIKNSTAVQAVDLDSGGINVNFTSADGSACRAGFIKLIDALHITNNATGAIDFYVSRQIMSNLQNHYSSSDVGFGTILQDLLKLAGVKSIKSDASLTGNEVVGAILDSQYIRPLVGMAVTTVPLFRGNPMDNYNFMTWANVGIEIKTDYKGQKGVLYAREIA